MKKAKKIKKARADIFKRTVDHLYLKGVERGFPLREEHKESLAEVLKEAKVHKSPRILADMRENINWEGVSPEGKTVKLTPEEQVQKFLNMMGALARLARSSVKRQVQWEELQRLKKKK